MLVVVDEAQMFAPAAAGEVSDEARKVSLGAMTNLMCRGRKRGLAGVIATQRLAKLAKNVAAEASNFLMGRTFLDIDMARAADLLGMERRQAEMFRDLERGHFIALGPALSRRPLPLRIGSVETTGRTGSPKLTPLPTTAPEDARDLILAPGEPEPLVRPSVRKPMPPPPQNMDILFQLAQSRPVLSAPPEEVEEQGPEVDREPLLDDILRKILEDPEAAFRSVAVLYQDFLVRCRIHKVPGAPLDLAAFKRRLSAARAGVRNETADGPEWEQATVLAAGLPEDIQGVFLLIARAAIEKAPCPSDAELARAVGSRSNGRARRLLSYMDQRGFVVTRNDRGGNRIIALPGLGWETAPGDPNAADDPAAPHGGDLFDVA
jgi:hypothetical protein